MLRGCIRTTAGILFLCSIALPMSAGEGGGSHYVPGSRNDFLMGVFGPAGLYLRNDLWYYDYDVGAHARGGRTVIGADQEAWLNTLKLSYLTDTEFFGARYGASLAATYVIDAAISGASEDVSGVRFDAGGNISGMSDLYIAPLLLNWAGTKQHFTFQLGVYAPTGGYDRDKALNTGRNYWSYDIVGNYTWFDPGLGWEASASGGFLFNEENPNTDYRSGNEFHLDWTIAKHVSKTFTAGVSGYWLTQLEADEGDVAGPLDGSDIKAWSYGIGPSLQWSVPVGGGSIGVIAKGLFDIDAQDRLTGNTFMLSVTHAF